jgi:hypothetical protein
MKKKRTEIEKPPAAFAGSGLCIALLLLALFQALVSPRALWVVIRMGGLEMKAQQIRGVQIVLSVPVCISVTEVKQSSRGSVKG